MRLARRLAGLVSLAACCLAVPALAVAADLADPTRPPATLAAAGAAAPAGAPVLQSVMLSPKSQMAIISGQAVALGDSYQGARLVKISESEVVLRDGDGERVLKLFPDLHKQAPAGRAAAKNSSHSKLQK